MGFAWFVFAVVSLLGDFGLSWLGFADGSWFLGFAGGLLVLYLLICFVGGTLSSSFPGGWYNIRF